MKKIIFILITYLLINRCDAINLTGPAGGRAAAMGGTSVCEQGIWALQNNPAGLAKLQGWHFGLYYENHWLLKQTAFKSGGVVKNIPGVGCLGLSVCQFGWSQFSENKFGIAYARDFGPYLQMGAKANWMLLHYGEGYADSNAPAFELGVQSQVTERLMLGVCLFYPFVLRFGLAYQLADNFVGQLEIEKDHQYAGMRLSGGLECVLFNRFSLRAGAQYNPNIISFGAGYSMGMASVDIAAHMHQALGVSIQIGITGTIQ